MAITMPSIDVIFKQLATSAITRSERGYAILIVRDDTNKTFDYKEYNLITDVDEDDYIATNYQYIKDIFAFAPYKVCIVRIDATAEGGTAPTIADALSIVLENVKTGWITVADGTDIDFTTLSSWIKSQVNNKKTYKAVIYNATTAPDEKHIVNFVNEYVTFSDSRGKVTGLSYLPSLIGILAVCNITRGCTYYACSNLSKVTEVADNDVALGQGKFVLFNDGDTVRIANGVNSMTTTNGTTATEDMKFIENVEAMDLIMDDITITFHDYIGNYKNKYDNQMILISAINSYFRNLAGEDVLDSEYNNVADIDIEAQRAAWIAAGKTEASNWSDTVVRKTSYKRSVYLESSIKILGSMTDLKFTISLY